MQQPRPPERSPSSWIAQIVLRELHAAQRSLTAVNLAGRCFLPARQVGDALSELQMAGLASRRGHRWRAFERRERNTGAEGGRRRERRFPAA